MRWFTHSLTFVFTRNRSSVKKFTEPDKRFKQNKIEKNMWTRRKIRWVNRIKNGYSFISHASFQKVIVFNLSLKGKQVDPLWCKFSVDLPSAEDDFSGDLWPFRSSIFDDIFSASQMGPILIVLLFWRYRRILSATRQRPRPIWTRHIGQRSVLGRHFSHTIWPFTHWYVCEGAAGVWWERKYDDKTGWSLFGRQTWGLKLLTRLEIDGILRKISF